MISWDDFWTEIIPVLNSTKEFWEYLTYYGFSDEGVYLDYERRRK